MKHWKIDDCVGVLESSLKPQPIDKFNSSVVPASLFMFQEGVLGSFVDNLSED